jgi:hypothetical protein
MSPTSWPLYVITAVSALMYSASVTSIALVAALGQDAERRQHARETLKILVRHRPQQSDPGTMTPKGAEPAEGHDEMG